MTNPEQTRLVPEVAGTFVSWRGELANIASYLTNRTSPDDMQGQLHIATLNHIVTRMTELQYKLDASMGLLHDEISQATVSFPLAPLPSPYPEPSATVLEVPTVANLDVRPEGCICIWQQYGELVTDQDWHVLVNPSCPVHGSED